MGDLISRAKLKNAIKREKVTLANGLQYIRAEAVMAKIGMAPSVDAAAGVCATDDVRISREDFGVLVTCATRYAIGRRSYMPYLVSGIVGPMLDKLDDKTLGCLILDIEGAPSLGDVLIDEPLWRNLLEAARREQGRRNGK